MNSRLRRSPRTSVGWPSWSLERHRKRLTVWRERHVAVALVTPAAAPNGASGKKVSLQRLRGLPSLTGDFCNKICHKRTHAPQQKCVYSIISSARWRVDAGTSSATSEVLKIIHTRRSEQGICGVARSPSSTCRRYDGRRSELV